MMILLAEIGDKMPSPSAVAACAALPALLILSIASVRRIAFLFALPLVAFGNVVMWQEYSAPGFGPIILRELGWRYVIGCLIGWNGPFLLALIIAFRVHGLRRLERQAPGSCMNCGYNLTGNTSGLCPECGEKVKPPRAEAQAAEGGERM